MANENAVFLATNVDAIGPDCDVTDYDTVIAEMTSVRDDMVKFAKACKELQTPRPTAWAMACSLGQPRLPDIWGAKAKMHKPASQLRKRGNLTSRLSHWNSPLK